MKWARIHGGHVRRDYDPRSPKNRNGLPARIRQVASDIERDPSSLPGTLTLISLLKRDGVLRSLLLSHLEAPTRRAMVRH